MLDGLFEGMNYYDFPSFQVALYSLLLALVLSSVIAFTYKYTYNDFIYSGNFFQAMVLSSMVSSMVIMAVGNNVAVGFGIIGAVAIIRFRTRVQNPRNIIFIFAAISTGIATGVYGYAIALAGTMIFCIAAFILYFSPFGNQAAYYFTIGFSLKKESDVNIVKSQLVDRCNKVDLRLVRIRQANERREADVQVEFLVLLNINYDLNSLKNFLSELEATDVKIEKRSIAEEL